MDGTNGTNGANGADGANEKQAAWRRISGITVENYHTLPEAEYRAGVQRLMDEVQRMMEEELEQEEFKAPRITGVEVWDWPRTFSLRTGKERQETGDGRQENALTPRAQTAAPVGPLPGGEGEAGGAPAVQNAAG